MHLQFQSKIQCATQVSQETLRRDDVRFGRFRQGSRETVRGECDVWSAWGQDMTFAHIAAQCSMFFCTRVLIVTIIVASDSRSDNGFLSPANGALSACQVHTGKSATPIWRRRIAGILNHVRLCCAG